MAPALFTVEEVAARFRVSRSTLREFIQTHPYYRRLGQRKLFTEASSVRSFQPGCMGPSVRYVQTSSRVLYFLHSMNVTSRTYTLSIERHDDGYLAYFRALPGCHTWGKTYEDAVKNAEEALALYLETLDELGRTIPEEKNINEPVSLGVTVRVPVIA